MSGVIFVAREVGSFRLGWGFALVGGIFFKFCRVFYKDIGVLRFREDYRRFFRDLFRLVCWGLFGVRLYLEVFW